MLNVKFVDNYCYSAVYLELVNVLNISNFSCINNNNNAYSRLKENAQDYGACLDIRNTHNASISNFSIVSCFSQTTACGLKIYYEKDKGGKYNKVFLIFIDIYT